MPRPHAILTSLAGAAAGPAFIAAGWSVEAPVPRAVLSLRDGRMAQVPVRLVVTFGRPVDVDQFEFHYQVRHLDLVLAMPHCASVESSLVAGDAAGSRNAYHWVTGLMFSTVADLIRSLSSREGQAVLANIATFATAGATATIVTNRRAATHAMPIPPASRTGIPKADRRRGSAA